MALTDIDKVRYEVGLVGEAQDIFADEDIQYYLDENKGNIKKTGKDLAVKVLFVLAQYVHERSGTELEIWGHTWFENYKKALELYLNNTNYNGARDAMKFYAGGISVTDIRKNMEQIDTLPVDVDIGIPTDGEASFSPNTNKSVFKVEPIGYTTSPFNI